MNRKWISMIGLAVSALALTPAALASGIGPVAVGLKAGTTGLGIEAVKPINHRWNARVALNGFSYDRDFEEGDIDYNGELRLQSASLMADWYVFRGSFRITPGVFINNNELRGKARGSLDIGENTYEASLDAVIDWPTVAPYLGIGWGNQFRGGRLTLSADLGVLFTGSPSVSLKGRESTGMVDLSVFEEDLNREVRTLERDLRDAKYFPVATLGLAYRF